MGKLTNYFYGHVQWHNYVKIPEGTCSWPQPLCGYGISDQKYRTSRWMISQQGHLAPESRGVPSTLASPGEKQGRCPRHGVAPVLRIAVVWAVGMTPKECNLTTTDRIYDYLWHLWFIISGYQPRCFSCVFYIWSWDKVTLHIAKNGMSWPWPGHSGKWLAASVESDGSIPAISRTRHARHHLQT